MIKKCKIQKKLTKVVRCVLFCWMLVLLDYFNDWREAPLRSQTANLRLLFLFLTFFLCRCLWLTLGLGQPIGNFADPPAALGLGCLDMLPIGSGADPPAALARPGGQPIESGGSAGPPAALGGSAAVGLGQSVMR